MKLSNCESATKRKAFACVLCGFPTFKPKQSLAALTEDQRGLKEALKTTIATILASPPLYHLSVIQSIWKSILPKIPGFCQHPLGTLKTMAKRKAADNSFFILQLRCSWSLASTMDSVLPLPNTCSPVLVG